MAYVQGSPLHRGVSKLGVTMTRLLELLAALCIAFAASAGSAAAQQPPAAPEPKMPPMPSMEGQQGDVSKPITQIPPRKKAAGPEPKKAMESKKAAPPTSKPHAASPRKKR